jgi:hypothetical protein
MITLIMEAVRSSETSVYSNETTRRNIPEDSKRHIRHRENLKYDKSILVELSAMLAALKI